MSIDFNKIKFWMKENKIDIFYVAAMILVMGLAIFIFIWSTNIVLNAVNAAFAIIPQKIESEILRFDLDSLEKISKRLNIDFQLITPAVSAPAISTVVTSTAVTSTAAILTSENQETPIDISKINIKILNGTTITGLAGDWKKNFIIAGFAEGNIKTGNADVKTYFGITVSYNTSDKFLAKVMKVLQAGNLTIKSTKDEKLNKDSFLVIIGK